MIEAIAAVTASVHRPLENAAPHPPITCICALSTRMPTGAIAKLTHRSTRSIDDRSSDRISENFFASSANRFAYKSAPTFVTRAAPSPATTMEPDSTSLPGSLSTASDSPVSIDSSTCSPRAVTTSASAGI